MTGKPLLKGPKGLKRIQKDSKDSALLATRSDAQQGNSLTIERYADLAVSDLPGQWVKLG
jgi:hypothetical protein